MKIPKQVKIGAHLIDIVLTDQTEDFGCFENKKARIIISKETKPSLQEETFFHECLHSIFDQTGVGRGLTADDEEKMIQPIANMLYQFLKDNDLLK